MALTLACAWLAKWAGEAHAGCALVRVTGSRRIVRLALDLHPTGLEHLEAQVADVRLQWPVAGQQQALTIGIQPPGHIDAEQINEILEPAPAALRCELAQDAVGSLKQMRRGATWRGWAGDACCYVRIRLEVRRICRDLR